MKKKKTAKARKEEIQPKSSKRRTWTIVISLGAFLIPLIWGILTADWDMLPKNWKKVTQWYGNATATDPIIKIERSFFNNCFNLGRNSQGHDSIFVTGMNTNYQVWFRLINNAEEELEISKAELLGDDGITISKLIYYPKIVIAPANEKVLKIVTPPAAGNFLIVDQVQKGWFDIEIETNHKTVKKRIDGICVYNGSIMPNGKKLYVIGKDTTFLNPDRVEGFVEN